MKNTARLILAFALFCPLGALGNNADTTIPPTEIIDGGVQITDSWISSGGRDISSFRNHHFMFDVTQSGNITISIESTVDNYLYLINSLGFIVVKTDSDEFTEDLSPGTYTIIAATYSALQKSNYVLKVQGAFDNIRKINSQRIEQIGNWTSSGGQLKESYRNDHYLFDVTSDSYVDITIESSVDSYLYLINSLGFIVVETDSNRLVSSVPADSYMLVVATYSAGQVSNYVLTIVGQFSNLTEKTSNVIETIESWTSSGGQNRYSVNNPSYLFNVTEESLVDITIVSSVDNYLYLVDSLDNIVQETDADRLTALVPAGQYKLVAATYSVGKASNFVLTIYGQVDNFWQNSQNSTLPTTTGSGGPIVTKTDGTKGISNAKFSGGWSEDDGPYKSTVTYKGGAATIIQVIHFDPAHVEEEVDIFVQLKLHFSPPDGPQLWYQVSGTSGLITWDESPATIEAFETHTIVAGEPKVIGPYNLGELGEDFLDINVEFKFGYRLNNGTVITVGQPTSLRPIPVEVDYSFAFPI
jgi:hypothetical protein